MLHAGLAIGTFVGEDDCSLEPANLLAPTLLCKAWTASPTDDFQKGLEGKDLHV